MSSINIHDLPETSRDAIGTLLDLVSEDMAEVNALLLSRVESEISLISEITYHIISSGGKRIRPILTLACAHMCGYENGGSHIKLAAAVEFMHTATLLHDDVVDESTERRGKPTARILWNNQASVLVGDFLLGQAFRMMVETRSLECLDILSYAAARIAEGEVKQLAAAYDIETDSDHYLEIISAKTAALFSAAAQVGAVLGAASSEQCEALNLFGHNLGIAFQLIDDVLDYSGSSKILGKKTGNDFREGKITLPVILAFKRGSPDERDFWYNTTRKIKEVQSEDVKAELFDRALLLLQRHSALKDTIALASDYAASAHASLAAFPPNPYRKALEEAANFCIHRTY